MENPALVVKESLGEMAESLRKDLRIQLVEGLRGVVHRQLLGTDRKQFSN